MLEYCIGEVGLRPDEFWTMTFEEVGFACSGYEMRQAREREVERLIATILLNVNRGEDNPAYMPEDVFPLYTDKFRETKIMSKEEYKDFNEQMDKVIWQTG
jgi:hypothetical protein